MNNEPSVSPQGGARVSSGKDSKQDYETPLPFIRAVEVKFGLLGFDLAASGKNTKAFKWITEETNSLTAPWSNLPGTPPFWLNPPYKNIAPWAHKCHQESLKGANILLLVPASVDSNWWAEHVHKKAVVYFVNPRISFDGVSPYPKPLALCQYDRKALSWAIGDWYRPWRWKA